MWCVPGRCETAAGRVLGGIKILTVAGGAIEACGNGMPLILRMFLLFLGGRSFGKAVA